LEDGVGLSDGSEHSQGSNPPEVEMSFSRRKFLSIMGTTAAVPLLPSALRATMSNGSADGPPRRLVIVYTPNGTVPGEFFPPEGSDRRNFTPGEVFEPFQSRGLVDDLTFFRGFDNVYGDDGHWSVGSLLTGVAPHDREDHNGDTVDGLPKGPSVDQVIGAALKRESPGLQRSLNLGICADGYSTDAPQATISYTGDQKYVLPENNPDRIFQNLFGDITKSEQELEKIRAEGGSVLDLVRRNFDRFKKDLSKRDRKRVESHWSAVRELEKKITDPDSSSCKSQPDGFGGEKIDWSAKSNTPTLSEMQQTLIAKSFECDLTRVGTLMYSQENNGMAMTWLSGHSSSDIHHHWSHMRNPVHDEDASKSKAIQKLLDINKWYAGEIAAFAERLNGIDDPVANDGSTLFDNTLMVWVNNLYDGGKHNTKNLPLVTIGDAGGAIDSGQYLEFDGRSHQDFLVTLCRAMGLQRETFGDPANCSGPIQEVLT